MHLSAVVRRVAVAQLPFVLQTRAHGTLPLHNFTLDRSLFNNTLYTHIHDLWFGDIPSNVSAAPVSALKRWFGQGTPEEKAAFDERCAEHTRQALAAINPQKLKLPAFETNEVDEENAVLLSAPFLQEIKNAQETSEKNGADVLLALVLLLDQMPRNLFREEDTLPLVYTHYDRLSLALLRSSMQLSPSPVDYSSYALRPALKMWYYMPLVHSEQLSSHLLWYELMQDLEKKLIDAGDEAAVRSLEGNYKAEEQHIAPIRRFGRYPHRNAFLGRENTPEEDEFLKTAETFGVVKGDSRQTEAGKDEL